MRSSSCTIDLRIMPRGFSPFQYPVVAVDNEVPITDPFTGQRCGHLTILLALGSQQQVCSLIHVPTEHGTQGKH